METHPAKNPPQRHFAATRTAKRRRVIGDPDALLVMGIGSAVALFYDRALLASAAGQKIFLPGRR